jgi:DNA-binding transcriptional regulator GbsR (MarR family)
MELEAAKTHFVQTWGSLGSQWGISRTMAQVHALLLVSPDALSTEDVMETLSISRGNANQNLRALIDWGLVVKVLQPGERREYFRAYKDIWHISKQIIRERHKRELEPVQAVLQELSVVEEQSPEAEAFRNFIGELQELLGFLKTFSELALQADPEQLLQPMLAGNPEATKS